VAKPAHVDARIAANRYRMRNAVYLELADGQVTRLQRMVDQLRVIVCLVGSERIRQRILAAHRCGDSPFRRGLAGGRQDFHFARQVLLAADGKEDARPVEIGMGIVEVGTANTQVVRVDLGDQGQRLLHGCRAPAALVEFCQRYVETVRFRTN
jgi:hypothetical protein